MSTPATSSRSARVGVIGAGFSGLGLAVRLRQMGEDFILLERGETIGGTWRDNDYPGAACDVPSNLYSFSFADNPDWSTTFAHQDELLAYTNRIAEQHGLVEHAHCRTTVEDARWDDAAKRWRVTTNQGEYDFQVLVSATGPLSEPKFPDIAGLEDFEGPVFHSAQWDHSVDLAGKRVGVIGTGASAIQFVPQLQKVVGELKLFQRTPAWTLPRAEFATSARRRRLFRQFPVLQKIARQYLYAWHELYVIGFTRDIRLMKAVRLLSARHLRRSVKNPELRKILTPDYTIGCKRILLSNDYWPSLDQPNVEVIPGGVTRIGPRSITSASGEEREVDAIVLGTGFHVADMPIASAVRGADGRTLEEHWAPGAGAYRGATVPGFPNFFFILGPNTGLGHSSMIYMIESAANYVVEALKTMDRHDLATVEVRPERFQRWNEGVQKRMPKTVWMGGGCASWYLDEHGRNTTLWPDFTFRFRALTKRFDLESYTTLPARSDATTPPPAVTA